MTTPQCGCVNRIAQMNAWGLAGCKRNFETIVGWLKDEARKNYPTLSKMWGTEKIIRLMISRAIKKAERAARR